MLTDMTLQAFIASADLAIAISIAALSVSALRSGRRPRRNLSWVFFALASITLVVHSTFGTQGAGQAEAAALSSGNQGPLGGHFTDSALADVIQQMGNQAASGSTPTIRFQPTHLTVLRAPDPNNSAFTGANVRDNL